MPKEKSPFPYYIDRDVALKGYCFFAVKGYCFFQLAD